MNHSTITALATPPGIGGIGIIRISGKNALSIAESIFIKKRRKKISEENRTKRYFKNKGKNIKTHKLYLGHIIDKEKGKKIDEVLLSVMKAPNSYTKEDVVEINAHSGQVALNEILKLVVKKGARLAKPGEFTKRAFLNGRIDLTQAEAVIDLINARTERSLEIATSQIEGNLKTKVSFIRDSLIKILTEIEVGIDFPDELTERLDSNEVIERIKKEVSKPLEELLQNYEKGHVFREGIRLVIAGKPNVGKSSLMNRMVNKERTIVTPFPGTTRDIIEETININGIPAVISDTAGLHRSKDPVEVLGIKKAYEAINISDIVLFVIDASVKITKDDYKVIKDLKNNKKIIVINKIDLVDKKYKLKIPESLGKTETVKISALYNIGLEKLNGAIANIATNGLTSKNQGSLIPNLRHKIEIEKCLKNALRAKKGLKKETPFELIAIDLKETIDSLNEIMGISAKEEILDKIFCRFCIGK